MSLPTALASLARVVSASGTGPVRPIGQGAASTSVGPLPHLEPAIAVGLLAALTLTCIIVLGRAACVTLQRHVALRHVRRASAAASARLAASAQEHHLGRLAVDAPRPFSASTATAEVLRLMESMERPPPMAATTSDQDWHTLVEEVPGVGRIEWDPLTLRAFAYQPDVLYRLAFHRWRLQQGTLSEFDVAHRAGRRERGDERGELHERLDQTSRPFAPSAQELRALSPGQPAARADP